MSAGNYAMDENNYSLASTRTVLNGIAQYASEVIVKRYRGLPGTDA